MSRIRSVVKAVEIEPKKPVERLIVPITDETLGSNESTTVEPGLTCVFG